DHCFVLADCRSPRPRAGHLRRAWLRADTGTGPGLVPGRVQRARSAPPLPVAGRARPRLLGDRLVARKVLTSKRQRLLRRRFRGGGSGRAWTQAPRGVQNGFALGNLPDQEIFAAVALVADRERILVAVENAGHFLPVDDHVPPLVEQQFRQPSAVSFNL